MSLTVPLIVPRCVSVFLTVLEFIYSNSCSLKAGTVVDVLASAIEYGLEGLAACCATFITSNLTIDTACSAIQVLVQMHAPQLPPPSVNTH